jgi:hypothetical protein
MRRRIREAAASPSTAVPYGSTSLYLEVSWDEGALPATKDMNVEGVAEISGSVTLPYALSFGDCDTGYEMKDELTALAYPHLHRLYDAVKDEQGPTPEALRSALQKELQELARYLWRQAQIRRATEPKSALLESLGLDHVSPLA